MSNIVQKLPFECEGGHRLSLTFPTENGKQRIDVRVHGYWVLELCETCHPIFSIYKYIIWFLYYEGSDVGQSEKDLFSLAFNIIHHDPRIVGNRYYIYVWFIYSTSLKLQTWRLNKDLSGAMIVLVKVDYDRKRLRWHPCKILIPNESIYETVQLYEQI